jgi:hypothetical protein
MLVQNLIYKDNNIKISSPELVYNENKIVSYGSLIYTYTGNVITKETCPTFTYEFAYENGKLAYYTEKFTGDNNFIKVVYTYNTDKTISFKKYRVLDTSEREIATGTLTFKNGNLVKKEFLDKQSSKIITKITLKEYDTQNNPYKNILGFDLLFDDERFFSNLNNNANNIIKTTTTSSDMKQFFSDSLAKNIRKYEYKYNSNDFPIARSEFDKNGNNYTLEYFY